MPLRYSHHVPAPQVRPHDFWRINLYVCVYVCVYDEKSMIVLG